jgi:hypothetical protein
MKFELDNQQTSMLLDALATLANTLSPHDRPFKLGMTHPVMFETVSHIYNTLVIQVVVQLKTDETPYK